MSEEFHVPSENESEESRPSSPVNAQIIPAPSLTDDELDEGDYVVNLEETDSEDEEEIPTDEDDPGSLVDFVVNEADESDFETEEEEEEEEEDEEDEDEEEDDSYDPAVDSDGSYEPPVPIETTDKPVRRSTRNRKLRITQPIDDGMSDSESDFEDEDSGSDFEGDEIAM